jgi:TatD DNase family protein
MIFESHAHYDDSRFKKDRHEILSSLKDAGVGIVINAAANIKSSLKSIELAKKYDFIYPAVGVHPHDISDLMEEDLETLIGLASYNKVVAIGEIGLDYYYDNSPREVQKLWFREQINIAKEIELPLIIHSREAANDTYEIIKNSKAYEVGGVIHCFSGSKEMAQKYIDMGFYIGVGGVITFSNAQKVKEVVKAIPIDRILIETDCPYLTPVPNRGKRNDSTNLKYVIEEIGKIKGLSSDEVEDITYRNGERLFFVD